MLLDLANVLRPRRLPPDGDEALALQVRRPHAGDPGGRRRHFPVLHRGRTRRPPARRSRGPRGRDRPRPAPSRKRREPRRSPSPSAPPAISAPSHAAAADPGGASAGIARGAGSLAQPRPHGPAGAELGGAAARGRAHATDGCRPDPAIGLERPRDGGHRAHAHPPRPPRGRAGVEGPRRRVPGERGRAALPRGTGPVGIGVFRRVVRHPVSGSGFMRPSRSVSIGPNRCFALPFSRRRVRPLWRCSRTPHERPQPWPAIRQNRLTFPHKPETCWPFRGSSVVPGAEMQGASPRTLQLIWVMPAERGDHVLRRTSLIVSDVR